MKSKGNKRLELSHTLPCEKRRRTPLSPTIKKKELSLCALLQKPPL